MPSNDIMLRDSSTLAAGLSNAPLPARILKQTRNELAELSADLVVSESKLEAGAFLAGTAITQHGTLTALAEAIVNIHPAAAQGCSQILNAYSMGAADIIRRIVR